MPTDYYETLCQEDIDVGTGIVSKRNPAGGLLSSTQVNLSSLALTQAAVTQSWTPGAITLGNRATVTVTVPGAALGDFVLASFDAMESTLDIICKITATDTVSVSLFNPATAGGVTPSTGTLRVLVFKSR